MKSLSTSAGAPPVGPGSFSPCISVRRRSVACSFWLISSCSLLMGVAVGDRDACSLVSGCIRIRSTEAQRLFTAVARCFSHGVSHEAAASRGRLWDFPEVSAVTEEATPSLLNREPSGLRLDGVFLMLSLKASQLSSSWIRSRVSIPSEEGMEAWTQAGSQFNCMVWSSSRQPSTSCTGKV